MIQPLHIEPNSVYDDGALHQTLGIEAGTLAKARREGRLRFTRKGKRTLYLGRWILEWLEQDSAPIKARELRPEAVAV